MKVAIPVNEKKVDSDVCMSFGRTPLFLVYDIESKENYFIDNSAVAAIGGAGIKAAQVIVDNGVEAMLTPRLGENAADVLKAGNIKIYKTSKEDNAIDNIGLFADGKLDELTEIHAGFHGHGDGSGGGATGGGETTRSGSEAAGGEVHVDGGN